MTATRTALEGPAWSCVDSRYTRPVPVSLAEVATSWRRREAERAERAARRARRLLALVPGARAILVDQHGARAAYLFGSLAAGTCREGSDLDLAVEGLAPDRYLEALADLMTLVGGPVDLVRLEDAPETLKARVHDEGRRL